MSGATLLKSVKYKKSLDSTALKTSGQKLEKMETKAIQLYRLIILKPKKNPPQKNSKRQDT